MKNIFEKITAKNIFQKILFYYNLNKIVNDLYENKTLSRIKIEYQSYYLDSIEYMNSFNKIYNIRYVDWRNNIMKNDHLNHIKFEDLEFYEEYEFPEDLN